MSRTECASGRYPGAKSCKRVLPDAEGHVAGRRTLTWWDVGGVGGGYLHLQVSNTESGVLAGGRVVNAGEITSKGPRGSDSE